MIYPATRWFEILRYNNNQSDTISNLVEKTWLCKYPIPTIISYDHGDEFLGHSFKNNLFKKYGIKDRCETIANPQVNSILERVHEVIANLVRKFDLKNNYLDENG